jgi:hypothetical protein
MNTFWLKVAGAVVAVVVATVLIAALTSSGDEPATEPTQEPGQKTFYDIAERDRERLLAEPQPANSVSVEPNDKPQTSGNVPPPPEPVVLYFKPLGEIEKIEAERLLNVAVPGRSIGRLPTTGFGLMVEPCRQIISKWPDSWYAYKARLMFAEMPERYRARYNVTAEEMDVSMYSRQRPGTEPFTVKDLK